MTETATVESWRTVIEAVLKNLEDGRQLPAHLVDDLHATMLAMDEVIREDGTSSRIPGVASESG